MADDPMLDGGSAPAPGRPYLRSGAALNACTREFARLMDQVVAQAEQLAAAHDVTLVVKRGPERLVIQVGPVAVTLAWLRHNLGSVADGQLLAIVWRGTVTPGSHHVPERLAARAASAKSIPVWEQSFTPVAADEATWEWQAQKSDDGTGRIASGTLAERCGANLRKAYTEALE